MKRILLFISFLFLALVAHATGQTGDVIFIDGSQWVLLGRPVALDSVLYHDLKAVLPEDRPIVSSNWDGFTGYWSIQQDQLCLDSVKCDNYDSETQKLRGVSIPSDTLLRVFKKYVDGNCIVASWLTREIRVATGKMIYYQHTYFERNYEEEMILSIVKGKVTGRKEYHNYIVDGFSFDKKNQDNHDELREMFPLHIERYPELVSEERIVFRVKQARVDAEGNLVECEVKVLKPNDNPLLAAEIAESLKAYHPWRLLFINGEYSAKGIEGWIISYPLGVK
jgi:hypothetical protein